MELRAATRRRSTLDRGSTPDRTPGHAVPTRAYQSDRRVDTSRRALPAQQEKARTRRPALPCPLTSTHPISVPWLKQAVFVLRGPPREGLVVSLW